MLWYFREPKQLHQEWQDPMKEELLIYASTLPLGKPLTDSHFSTSVLPEFPTPEKLTASCLPVQNTVEPWISEQCYWNI